MSVLRRSRLCGWSLQPRLHSDEDEIGITKTASRSSAGQPEIKCGGCRRCSRSDCPRTHLVRAVPDAGIRVDDLGIECDHRGTMNGVR